MKKFIGEDFMLGSPLAQELYEYAQKMPIIDYHCHIDPKDIATDKKYNNITEIWLGGDHYKWRAMRSCGVAEKYITGDSTPYEKFLAYAKILPNMIGSPIYVWSHLELQRYFGYSGALSEKTADEVWNLANAKLNTPEMSAKNIVKNSNVKLLCTTDDPISDLAWHKEIAKDKNFGVKVLPAFRPDKGMYIERKGFVEYIASLENASGIKIDSFAALKKAYIQRIEYFVEMGCVTADQGFDDCIIYENVPSENALEEIFQKGMNAKELSAKEVNIYKTAMMQFFAEQYKNHGWVMQIHFGVKRNVNGNMFSRLGVDSGFDIINGTSSTADLAELLNSMEINNALPKTIIYSINPSDDESIGVLCGAFQTGENGLPKVTQGSAWWFNDNNTGMRKQLNAFANASALGTFVGMLTDSRSFLSYTRHEYFRRILCDVLANFVNNGEYPYDIEMLSNIVENICYNNTQKFFNFQI